MKVEKYVLGEDGKLVHVGSEIVEAEEENNKPTQEERITELEEALEMLLTGVTE